VLNCRHSPENAELLSTLGLLYMQVLEFFISDIMYIYVVVAI